MAFFLEVRVSNIGLTFALVIWLLLSSYGVGNLNKLIFSPCTTKIVSFKVVLFADGVVVNCPN